ncbi:hypothetical protein PEDI_44520 [Persicobacter diffluens]|uniref:Uncharacterized protein n=1 Tax=Persicobacter diffluens TaxID=981 RepID=A0AAN4W3K0_9BACT|nr:hypothetical protein PEDI_44520 [Persicobacter diffluens]
MVSLAKTCSEKFGSKAETSNALLLTQISHQIIRKIHLQTFDQNKTLWKS